ncbi:nuclear transport factor 2 family protein [Nevskia sp.]|uniref:YybH family protein n=1 Tax=Nevskia sp. TaxID=1929292 RepID=UPI0025F36862|nr:nuclear transport factor 2 family protein [Nevskia sp.]
MNADSIKKTVDSYIAAWNARDFERMAAHFTEPAVFVLASGTHVLPTRAALAEFLRAIFVPLEARSFGHTVIGAITSRALADGLFLAEVDDIRRYHRDGHLLETIEVQYTLRREADALLIVSALWCDPGWRQRLL